MVVGLADRRVPRGLCDVGRLVDHHRRVARADAVRRLAGAVGGAHHRGAAGRDRQIADCHQLVRKGDARFLDALQQIFWRIERAKRRAHQPHRFIRRLLAGRVGREDHRVLALDRVDGDADGRDVRARHRDQRGDHAGRFRVLDDAFLGNLLDDAHALLAERVTEDAQHFGAAARFAAAHAAFVDAHVRQPPGRRFVARRPADRLAQAIDARLVVALDGLHGGARTAQQVLRQRLFVRSDRSCCHIRRRVRKDPPCLFLGRSKRTRPTLYRRTARGCGHASVSRARIPRRPPPSAPRRGR